MYMFECALTDEDYLFHVISPNGSIIVTLENMILTMSVVSWLNGGAKPEITDKQWDDIADSVYGGAT